MQDDLDWYLAFVRNFKLLGPDEEIELFRKVKSGDEQALESVVQHNLALVVSIAKNYWKGDNRMDLIQEGNLGLINAAKHYDPDKINPESGRPYKFSTYAFYCIRGYITRYFKRLGEQCVSLSTPLGDDFELSDTIAHKDGNPVVAAESSDARDRISVVLQDLSYRERFTLVNHYGLLTGVPLQMKEIGVYLGLSRQAISLIAARAREKVSGELKELVA